MGINTGVPISSGSDIEKIIHVGMSTFVGPDAEEHARFFMAPQVAGRRLDKLDKTGSCHELQVAARNTNDFIKRLKRLFRLENS